MPIEQISSKRLIRGALRGLGPYLLPEAFLYKALALYQARTPRTQLPTARGHRVYSPQSGVRLEVYWVDETLGPGPGASLFVFEQEVFRLDCFGGTLGHYHYNPRQIAFGAGETIRIYFPESSRDEQIHRAAFEIEKNTPAALKMNRDPKVRNLELPPTVLRDLADHLRVTMKDLLVEMENASR